MYWAIAEPSFLFAPPQEGVMADSENAILEMKYWLPEAQLCWVISSKLYEGFGQWKEPGCVELKVLVTGSLSTEAWIGHRPWFVAS